jgi:hypothetical protein
MKKLISSVTLCAILMGTTPVVSASTLVDPPAESKKMTVDAAFKTFKKSVFLQGGDYKIATEVLVDQLVDAKVTSGELELYVAKNSTKEGYQNFNEMMDVALEDVDSLADLGKEDLSFLLQNALQKTTATGSNFMSCTAGLGVGVPLIAVGVIMGIVSLANATASKEAVTQEFIKKKREQSEDYLNTIADLEFEKTTYESDIIYYGDEITELQRRIDSGMYDAVEVEEMYKLIRDYEFFISDSHALIGEVGVDIAYFENQYDSDVRLMDAEEASLLSEVDEKHARAGKVAIAAGVIGGVGAVFTAVGAQDCN